MHALQKPRVKDVRFVHYEADLFSFGTRAAKHSAQVLIKVVAIILVGNFDLKDAQAIHPRDEAGQCGLKMPRSIGGDVLSRNPTFPLPLTPINKRWPWT